jgi:hypothetical protein
MLNESEFNELLDKIFESGFNPSRRRREIDYSMPGERETGLDWKPPQARGPISKQGADESDGLGHWASFGKEYHERELAKHHRQKARKAPKETQQRSYSPEPKKRKKRRTRKEMEDAARRDDQRMMDDYINDSEKGSSQGPRGLSRFE